MNKNGLTLVELLVTTAIVVVLASILIPAFSFDFGPGQYQDNPHYKITQVTLLAVRDAILGNSAEYPGYLADMDEMPTVVEDLLVNPYAPNRLYDPITKKGWRGPYLRNAGSDGTTIKDGWGNNVKLYDANPLDENLVRVVSGGYDGRFETADDVVQSLKRLR